MNDAVTGRCYCGASSFSTSAPPQVVTYCHCRDCRRVTGAPVAAFAAFEEAAVAFEPGEGRAVSVSPGVTRSFCPDCGSPLTGRYDYLPGQVYIALGLFDAPELFPPQHHAHAGNCLSWLRITDDLDRSDRSARKTLSDR